MKITIYDPNGPKTIKISSGPSLGDMSPEEHKECPEDCPHCPESRCYEDCPELKCIYDIDEDEDNIFRARRSGNYECFEYNGDIPKMD